MKKILKHIWYIVKVSLTVAAIIVKVKHKLGIKGELDLLNLLGKIRFIYLNFDKVESLKFNNLPKLMEVMVALHEESKLTVNNVALSILANEVQQGRVTYEKITSVEGLSEKLELDGISDLRDKVASIGNLLSVLKLKG